MSGELKIKPSKAKLTRNTEVLGKMDPYVKVIVGDKKAKGAVCQDGGKTPTWKDTISIHRSFEPVCYIEVYDKDKLTADDIIGVGQIDLNALQPGTNKATWYPLFHKQKSAGEIKIEIEWTLEIKEVNGKAHHSHPEFGNF